MFQRRSIRKYLDRKVEKRQLELILEAAMAAPSALDMQPWEFVVMVDEANLTQIRTAFSFARYEAPAAVLVCGNETRMPQGTAEKEFWVQDCSAATQNMLLAATAMGLGSVWMGIYPRQERVAKVREIFGLPGHIVPFSIVYVGYPAEKKEPRTRFDEGKVHWEQYGKGKK